ncbi:hypothetical protein AB0E69_19285 [Kribbella sp. NPDC026611]|uniref:hypothetical protein n=1 Tax=Kribbella sp. NPDC026611 TaxID=3154911 RepID=UPI0033F0F884
MLTARTLVEAQIYVSLTTAADLDVPAVEPAELQPGVNLTEGEDAWTLASTAGDITIRYASEQAARTVGARFGLGVSELIDAAQWAMVAASYGRRALEADLTFTGPRGENRSTVELNWEFAVEAVTEAIKFLPDGAAEVPAEAVWTAYGAQAIAREPQLVTRAKLYDDLEYYRGTLADYRKRLDRRS